jgi:hypothetical protein
MRRANGRISASASANGPGSGWRSLARCSRSGMKASFSLVEGVHVEQPGDLTREQLSEPAGVGAAEGVRDEDIRAGHLSGAKQRAQFGGDRLGRARQPGRAAPAGAAPVVQHAGGQLRGLLADVR